MYNLRPHVPTSIFPAINWTSKTSHYVYILEIELPDTTIYKIGYTNNIKRRISGLGSVDKDSSKVRGCGIVINNIAAIASVALPKHSAGLYEEYLLGKYRNYRYKGKPILSNGNTELFTTNILDRILEDR
jgi:hypothetical protein